jgi:hypothetical protein
MAELLTRVDVLYLPDLVNYWLPFGDPRHWREPDRRRALAYFAPGQMFGYIRWEANEYGTRYWRFWIVRAGREGARLQRVPGIRPGAELLLDASGKARVKRTLEAIDGLMASEFDPANVAPAYFHHLQIRVHTRRPARPYTAAQYRAQAMRRELFP